MSPLFSGARLKIERANQHISELVTVLAFFSKEDFCRLSVEEDSNTRQHVIQLEMTKSLPITIPLVMGDIVHNLRSSLDLMFWEVVTIAGQTPTQYTKFPFRKTRDELVATLDGRKEQPLPAAIIGLIVDTIKPYPGGNDALYSLHQIDIMDKHKLLVPVLTIAGLTGVDMIDENGNAFYGTTLAVPQGKKLNAISFSGAVKITNYGKPAFNVLFDEGQAFEGQPVLPTLYQLSQLVVGTVNAMESTILALDI